MAYDIDPETRAVRFLYKFIKGSTNESYGVDVAKKANLLSSILVKAQQKSNDFRALDHRTNLKEGVASLIRRAIESDDIQLITGAKRKATDMLNVQ